MPHKLLKIFLFFIVFITFGNKGFLHAQITIEINGGENNVYTCPGDSVELNAAITGGQPPYSFQWSPSNGLSSASQQIVNAAPAVNTTYTLQVTDDLGNTASASVNVIVGEPNVLANALFDICSLDSLKVGLSSDIPGVTFSWTVMASGISGASAGNGDTIRQQLTNIANNSIQTAIYNVVANLNGCAGDTLTISVNVKPKPIISVLPVYDEICSEGTTNFQLFSSNLPLSDFT